MTSHRADTAFAALLVMLSVVLFPQALKLPIGWTSSGPGSGFFPFWLTVGVAFQAVLILIRNLRATVPRGRTAPFIPVEAWRPLLIVFLPMVAVIGLLRYFGIYLGGALYLAGYMTFVGRQRWITVLLIAVLLPLVLFFIFERWFLLPLPKGIILEYFLYGR